MKKQIRNNVFETNSSSSHSLSIPFKEDLGKYDDRVFNNEIVYFGEFGWEEETFYTPYEKLQYLITAVQYFDKPWQSDENYWDHPQEVLAEKYNQWINSSKYFKWIKEMLFDFNGSTIDIQIDEYEKWNTLGYIDHQSSYLLEEENIWSEDEDTFKRNMIEFIFNPEYVLHADNDNH